MVGEYRSGSLELDTGCPDLGRLSERFTNSRDSVCPSGIKEGINHENHNGASDNATNLEGLGTFYTFKRLPTMLAHEN